MHPTIDPDEITAAVGLKPSISSMAGRVRAHANPLGRKAIWSTWNLPLHQDGRLNSGVMPLAEFLIGAAQRFEHCRDLFLQLSREGGTVEFWVAWYSPETNSAGVLDYKLLKTCGDLGIGISIDAYWRPEEA